MFTKDIFSRLQNKRISIKVKNFGTMENNKYEGVLIGCSYGAGTELFLELDTGEFIYVKYIESIKEL